jgi:carboxymethylenebutenolidase
LSAFYRDHFIFNNPSNTELELISRTVGVDRVIEWADMLTTAERSI